MKITFSLKKINQANLSKYGMILIILVLFLLIIDSTNIFSSSKDLKFREIPLSVHAQGKGDYSAEAFGDEFPAVDISIVRAVLNEEHISPEELDSRMNVFIDALKKPVYKLTNENTPSNNVSTSLTPP